MVPTNHVISPALHWIFLSIGEYRKPREAVTATPLSLPRWPIDFYPASTCDTKSFSKAAKSAVAKLKAAELYESAGVVII